MIDKDLRHAGDAWNPEPVGLTKHEAAVRRSLDWADEAAERLDYAGALRWLAAVEATGDQLSGEYLDKRRGWSLAAHARSAMSAREHAAERPAHKARAGTMHLVETLPSTRLLGRCFGCGHLVFDRHAHEWATREKHQLCWPYDADAALFCGDCSSG